jgi:hypothetical protein
VGGWAKLFQLLASEDIDGDKMDLGMTVFTSLGGGHVDNLAGTVLDDHEAVLPQGRALHRKGSRSTGIGGVEGVIMLSLMSAMMRLEISVVCRKDWRPFFFFLKCAQSVGLKVGRVRGVHGNLTWASLTSAIVIDVEKVKMN